MFGIFNPDALLDLLWWLNGHHWGASYLPDPSHHGGGADW